MIALKKIPGEECFHVVEIGKELEDLQKEVGGYIECVPFVPGVVILCNEEGLLRGMPYNCRLFGHVFVGPVLVVGEKGEEFADLKDAEAALKTFNWMAGGAEE